MLSSHSISLFESALKKDGITLNGKEASIFANFLLELALDLKLISTNKNENEYGKQITTIS